MSFANKLAAKYSRSLSCVYATLAKINSYKNLEDLECKFVKELKKAENKKKELARVTRKKRYLEHIKASIKNLSLYLDQEKDLTELSKITNMAKPTLLEVIKPCALKRKGRYIFYSCNDSFRLLNEFYVDLVKEQNKIEAEYRVNYSDNIDDETLKILNLRKKGMKFGAISKKLGIDILRVQKVCTL